jgi:hypothetical protein
MKIVAKILAWHEDGWTMRAIAEELTEQGYPAPRKDTWCISTVRRAIGRYGSPDQFKPQIRAR